MKPRVLLALLIIMMLCLTGCGPEGSADDPAPESKPETSAPVTENKSPAGETVAVTPASAEVHFIDVGQGDCTFIDVGETEVLVDCGKADQSTKIMEYISPYVDGELDYFVATHPDDDHIGGAVGILRFFTVGTIIDSGAIKDTYTYYNYKEEAENQGIHWMEDEDTAFSLGEGNALQIIETGDGNIDVNEDSVVCVFRCGEVSVLLTGDMGSETEEKNLSKFPKVDVLKAGHHGSAYSTGTAFLKQTRPDYVIISAGKDNEYGHPAPETLKRISDIGAISYSTIDRGTIILKTDGKTLNFDFTGSAQVEEPADAATYGTGESTTDPSVSEAAGAAAAGTELTIENAPYIGNLKTRKFHYANCKSVRDMKDKNKDPLGSRDEAIRLGYEPCGNCHP